LPSTSAKITKHFSKEVIEKIDPLFPRIN